MLGSGMMSGGPRGLLRDHGDHETGRIRGTVLLQLLHLVKPYRIDLAVAAGLMLVATAGTLLVPCITRRIIDREIGTGNPERLLRVCLLLGGVMAITALASAFQRFLLSRAGQNTLCTLRNDLFAHLQDLSVAYNDSHIVGITISRVINDVSVINNLLSEGLLTLLADVIVIIGTIAVMLSMQPRLALITFTVLPPMAFATILFGRKARVAFRETREKVGSMVGNLAENIEGIRVIQSFAQEETSQRKFQERNWDNRTAHVRAMALSFIFLPVVDVLSVVATCIVLLAGGIMAAGGTATLGVIVAFMTYINRLFTPIRELSQLYATLQSASAGGERVLQLLQTRPVVTDSPEARDLAELQGRIEFRDVHFSYTGEREILHGVSMRIEPGETAAIVGPTGAGKTTIANLICRFYEPASGEVLIDGRRIQDITAASLHRHMGYVAQDPVLFSGTIAENIAFGCDRTCMADIVAAARHAEADAFVRRLPQQYDTRVLEGGANLSTGQRQLLSIARAVLVNPGILIMDEATASVDTVTEAAIQKALARLLQGRTAIVVAHRLTTVRRADRIYVIADGCFREQGSHEELLALNGMYRQLYDRQFV